MEKLSDIGKLNIKGQITIPNRIRKFCLKGSKHVGFRITEKGILLVPVEIKEKTPYTDKEWEQIENLASKKGKKYKTSKSAKNHIDTL